MYKVIKRDGSVVDFDLYKISKAITKAFESVDVNYDKEVIDEIEKNAVLDSKAKDNDTDSDADPMIEQAIECHAHGKPAVTHQQAEEQGYAERVGGMGGEEAVVAAMVIIDHIDEMAYLRVVGRSPAGHQGFDYLVVNGACHEHTQPGSCQDEHDGTPVGVVLDDHEQ